MRVAVIVPVLNEEATIAALLDSLREQTRPPDEIVIGDGGSTDGTLEILSKLAADEPRLRVVRGGGGISENRNAAISAATSELIACTDAGCIPEPSWLDRLVAPFENGAEWVAGFYRPVGVTTASTAAGAVMMTTRGEVDLDHFLPGGSSQAFTRRAWERAGGFPEGGGVGEDTVFGERMRALGYRPVFVPEALVNWQPPPSLAAMARKARTWGRADGINQVRTGAYAKVLVAYWFLPAAVLLASLFNPWLGVAGLVAYIALVLYRTRHKYAAVPGWRGRFWVPVAHVRQQMSASAGWIDGYGWSRLIRQGLRRLGLRSVPPREETAPVRHNVDLVVRTAREAKHWLPDLPDTYRVGAAVPDPHLPLVSATLTATAGEPRTAPVSVDFGDIEEPTLTDPVARFEYLRQTGHRYQLTPAPGGVTYRRDPVDTEIAVVVLAAVPLHDVGGGSRGAQLAQEMVARGIHVTYVHRFDAAETVDLGLRFIHPLLEERRWNEFVPAQYLPRVEAEHRMVLIEFPEAHHLAFARTLHDASFQVVYDLIDHWADPALGGWWYRPNVENEIVDLADHLIASAETLRADLATRSGRDVTLIANAVNSRLFDSTKVYARPSDLPPGRIIEYHGSLYGDWFWWEAVGEVARDNSDATVVLIGDRPAGRPNVPANVQLLGLKPQAALPAYLAHTDVALIPFVISETTHAVSPLKVYEYLAMGVPVAAPPLDSLRGLEGVVCDESLVTAVRAASAGPRPDPVTAVAAHSWGARLRALLRICGLDLPAEDVPVLVETRPVRHYHPSERLSTTSPPSASPPPAGGGVPPNEVRRGGGLSGGG